MNLASDSESSENEGVGDDIYTYLVMISMPTIFKQDNKYVSKMYYHVLFLYICSKQQFKNIVN